MSNNDSLRPLADDGPSSHELLELFLKDQFNSGSDDSPFAPAAPVAADDYSFIDTVEAFAAQPDPAPSLQFAQHHAVFQHRPMPTFLSTDFDHPAPPLSRQQQQQYQHHRHEMNSQFLIPSVQRAVSQVLLHAANSPTAPEITVDIVDPPQSGLSPLASDLGGTSPVLLSPSVSDSDYYEHNLYPPRVRRSVSSADSPATSLYSQANNSNLSINSISSELSVITGIGVSTPTNNLLLSPQSAVSISKSPRSRSNSRARSPVSRSPSADPEKARSRSLSASREYILELASNTPGSKKAQRHPSAFACDMCDKRFTRAYNLRSHKRTHTNERPYVCSLCPKAFARQHDRKRHEALHSGEKKYECRGVLADGVTPWGCGHRFARADALGRHFRTEAGKECIRTLVEEAEREKREKSIVEGSSDAPALTLSVVTTAGHDGAGDLPEALLLQFPMLMEKHKD
ncbi:hypothetical protein D0Z00_000003 [Geotrichum galactomycetum]|uniref:Uncharacterized protein n=1 Tax=Geotrichum galactomycetum TaxID=27317 RepID=A0ACB6VAV8_9ASCO|nr:hypothetical protein D0Z00_000003 [Geotrichum candidum]